MTTDNQQIPTIQMHDLSIDMNNGLLRLQQSDGAGD